MDLVDFKTSLAILAFIALVASILKVFAPYNINTPKTQILSHKLPPSTSSEPRSKLAQSEMSRVGSWGKRCARSLRAVGLLHQLAAGLIVFLSQIITITIRNPRFLVVVVLLMLPSDAFGMEHADGRSRITPSETATAAAVAAASVATLGVLGGRSKREIRAASKKNTEQRRVSKREIEVVEAQATREAQTLSMVRRLSFLLLLYNFWEMTERGSATQNF